MDGNEMLDAENIQNGARVIGSDGKEVGTVESVESDTRIRVRRAGKEAAPDFIPTAWAIELKEGAIILDRTAAEVFDTANEDIPAGEGTS